MANPILVGYDPGRRDRAPVDFGIAAANFTGAPLIIAAVHAGTTALGPDGRGDRRGRAARGEGRRVPRSPRARPAPAGHPRGMPGAGRPQRGARAAQRRGGVRGRPARDRFDRAREGWAAAPRFDRRAPDARRSMRDRGRAAILGAGRRTEHDRRRLGRHAGRPQGARGRGRAGASIRGEARGAQRSQGARHRAGHSAAATRSPRATGTRSSRARSARQPSAPSPRPPPGRPGSRWSPT